MWKIIKDYPRLKLLHMKAVPRGQGPEIELPTRFQDTRSNFDKFSDQWTLKPRRQINWAQTFARKSKLMEDYNFHCSVPVDFKIKHVFLEKHSVNGPDGVLFYQSGDPNATLQEDIVTFQSAEPVICALAIGSALSISRPTVRLLKALEGIAWITERNDLMVFEEWFGKRSNSAGGKRFITNFVDSWVPAVSFVVIERVLP